MQPWPGTSYPLGATYDGAGTNFALFSEVASAVTLCLFDPDGTEHRVPLPERDGFVWHGYLPGVVPGQRYGYRVEGPLAPEHGQRCNPHKLLIDPYAKAVDGSLGTTYAWDESLFGYHFDDPDEVNHDDSAQHVPKAVVVNPYFDWHDDRPPRTPYHETVVYEAHVKGLTHLHPEIPEEMRGTYSAVAHPATVSHLQRLGHHRDRAHAGAPVRARRRAGPAGPAQLLGLQHDRLLRARTSATRPPGSPAAPRSRARRCRSSRRWCATCTPPASR